MVWAVFLVVLGSLTVAGSLAAAARPQPELAPYEVTFLGDTFLGDRAEQVLEEKGYGWALEKLGDLELGDLVVLNAEAPITLLDRRPDSEKVHFSPGSPVARYYVYTSRGRVTRFLHRSSPEAAQALSAFGADLAILANNHALDQGPEGLADTRRNLADAGIPSIGAGSTAAQAAAPYVVETPYGRLGLFAFGEEGGTAPAATADAAGISTLSNENLDAAVRMAEESQIRWKVAVVHWGNNYADINESQQKWARRLANRGFSLVVGSGPHIAQAIEIVGRTPTAYSLGNFVFSSGGIFTEEKAGFGLALTAVLGPDGFRELRITCIETDNKKVHYQPRLASEADAARVLARTYPGIAVEGATGVIRW
jgi:hypothetical protein